MDITTINAPPTLPLTLTDKDGNAINIIVRQQDGYVDATLLCLDMKKTWGNYYRSAHAKDYMDVLSKYESIPIEFVPLRQTVRNGPENPGKCLIELGKNRHAHTYVHPQVAIHLAQWASPRFGVAVSKLIYEYTIRHPEVVCAFKDALSSDATVQRLQKGHVYILETNSVPSRVKIGHTRRTIQDLRERYRTAFPDQMRIYAIEVDDAYEAEQDTHKFFELQREAGEWFTSECLDHYIEYLTNVFGDNLIVHDDPNFTPQFLFPSTPPQITVR